MTGKQKRSRVTIREDSAKQLDASPAGIVNATFHLLTVLLGDSFAFSAPSMSTRRPPYYLGGSVPIRATTSCNFVRRVLKRTVSITRNRDHI